MVKGVKGFQKGYKPWNKELKGFVPKAAFKKGAPPPPHKKGCKCFRCTRKPWNRGKKTGVIPKSAFKKGQNTNERHYNWKGDKVGYAALHKWIQRKYGKANKCENPDCKYPRKNKWGEIIKKPKKHHWANITGIYARDRKNWKMLCSSCHRKYDNERPPNPRSLYDSQR